MAEKPMDRRRIIGAVARGVSAGLVLRLSQARASEKMTRQQSEYQDTPKGIFSCGMCTLFQAPNHCKVVEGVVSEDGWCKAFVLAD